MEMPLILQIGASETRNRSETNLYRDEMTLDDHNPWMVTRSDGASAANKTRFTELNRETTDDQ